MKKYSIVSQYRYFWLLIFIIFTFGSGFVLGQFVWEKWMKPFMGYSILDFPGLMVLTVFWIIFWILIILSLVIYLVPSLSIEANERSICIKLKHLITITREIFLIDIRAIYASESPPASFNFKSNLHHFIDEKGQSWECFSNSDDGKGVVIETTSMHFYIVCDNPNRMVNRLSEYIKAEGK
jgi:hypothetical protein